MSTQTKFFYSLIAVATVVSLATGGFYLADSLSGKNTTLADTLSALGIVPKREVSKPTTAQADQPFPLTLAQSGAPGADGEVGATGEAGAPGTSGLTGKRGTSGASGATGSAGSDGLSGSAGAIGETGATGATGSTGSSGSDGATGPSGSAGANGAAGSSGADGARGSIGAPGTTGNTGATGSQGPQGVAGADGGPLSTIVPRGLELNLENQVFGLTSGQYSLPDGSEGQQVFFFAADGAALADITILVSNLRLAADRGTVTIVKEGIWAPFSADLPSVNVVSAIFAQGAWTITGGTTR